MCPLKLDDLGSKLCLLLVYHAEMSRRATCMSYFGMVFVVQVLQHHELVELARGACK
jgi:hypothetical protein